MSASPLKSRHGYCNATYLLGAKSGNRARAKLGSKRVGLADISLGILIHFLPGPTRSVAFAIAEQYFPAIGQQHVGQQDTIGQNTARVSSNPDLYTCRD